jgi:hypothetical protein
LGLERGVLIRGLDKGWSMPESGDSGLKA